MKPVAIYVRVSTTKESQDQSPEAQLRTLKEYCDFRKWPYVEFVERKSGMLDENKRPILATMMAQVRKGKFSAVVVSNFTRFGRHPLHMIKTMYELSQLGVNFVAVEQSIDTTTPMGEVVFVVFAAMAKMQRDMIRDSVLRGLENAKAKGKTLGRRRNNVDLEKLRVYRATNSLRKCAATFGISKDTVNNLLRAGVPMS
jgi:DNA invertase Pin-like site-specific DNA recombinase